MFIIWLPVKSQTCREAGAENRGSLQGRTDSRVAWKGNPVLFAAKPKHDREKATVLDGRADSQVGWAKPRDLLSKLKEKISFP
jgi:hypothetical protein